jgi:hypothetical protein
MTLAELITRRAAYMAAELKILDGQEYRIRDGVIDRMMRRADLEVVQLTIKDLDRQIEVLSAQAAGTRRVLYLR